MFNYIAFNILNVDVLILTLQAIFMCRCLKINIAGNVLQ
jgi:hypothetical protein